ncbi:uncharacterized protein JCM6883_002199 [Sporobolomyces salmoneus]|uniref:uncharacterized protein n=1 Tax=Sporobolomyces salmoneus TaxID=183962 RepID=UPI00316D947F
MLQSTRLLRTVTSSVTAARAIRSSRPTTSFRHFTSTTSRSAVGDSLPNIILPSSNPSLQITSLTPSAGYTLSDGLVLPSPILMIDGVAFMWDVKPPVEDYKGGSWEGFDIEKLKVFEVVNPRPEILLVGTGKTGLFPPPKFKQYLNSLGIQVDVLDSRNAASTYNLLSEEGRRVAAALFPVSELSARTGLTK